MKHYTACSALGAALLACPALGQPLEEVVVVESQNSRTIDIIDTARVTPDIAELLRVAPGASINRNGPLTGIPQYRGMYGPRIAVSLNGRQLAPAGPNWMDPPLSYAVTAQLESLEIYRGIAPVSVAQESIGGAVDARTRYQDFSDSEAFDFSGRLAGSVRSVAQASQLDAELQASNARHRFKLAGMRQDGDDARFPGGDIRPTRYERERHDLGYGWQRGDHSLQLDYGHNRVNDSGTPALPMDIGYVDGDLYDLGYRFAPDGGLQLEAALYRRQLDHGMTNYDLRPLARPALARRNIATSDNLGFDVRARIRDASGHWGLGIDGFREEHHSDIDSPANPAFFVVNFNRAEREVLGMYLERELQLATDWRGEFGLRVNRVNANAGRVDGSPAMLMPPAAALRDAFNASDREQTDINLDLVAQLHYRASPDTLWYLGMARKQRSPSYQERYLWLPLEATGGLADSQVYIGDIDLAPEDGRIVEFGLDYNGARLTLSPRLFYHQVKDYIQGTPLGPEHPATLMVRMMNAVNGTRRPDPLQFANVEAELYGFDMDWTLHLDASWSLGGVVNLVRGRRRDIADELYRIAPLNMTVRLDHARQDWNVGLETVLFARQDKVSETNREQKSSGYGLLNLYAQWQPRPDLQLATGVENLLDRRYRSHLGGYNRVDNPDIGVGERLPGYGINVFARLLYRF